MNAIVHTNSVDGPNRTGTKTIDLVPASRPSRSVAWIIAASSFAFAASFDQGNARAEWLERVKKIREALTRDGRTLTQGALGWWTAALRGRNQQ